MRYVALLAVAGLILTVTATAGAVTFNFDPDDFIQLYSTTPLPVDNPTGTSHLKYEQDSPRRVHETWCGIMYNTFGSTNVGETDQESQDAYIAWRNSLDASNEGIASFNIWLRDNTNAWNWGERLVSNPDVKPTATAASGWQVEVNANPWGSGWLAEWWTDETDNLINLANDLDLFSFTVDVREITAAGQTYADGTDVALGTEWDIWFGSWHDMYNDDSAYSGWLDTGGWEGTLNLTAVPEPLTMFAVGMGIAGLAGYIRKRKLA